MLTRPCFLLTWLIVVVVIAASPAHAQTASAATQTQAHSPPPGTHPATAYLPNFAAIKHELLDLAAKYAACEAQTLASSAGGREVFVLILAADQKTAALRPAIFIVSGLDGRHRVGVETSLRVARNLLASHADLLNEVTFYVIPCANPDGFEFNLGEVNAGHVGNLHPVDDDRDGQMDEDGPADINGDGVITMMRRADPPLDDFGPATHLADPAEPRLLKRSDAAKGERAMYAVFVEGLDADNDGQIAEDGPGEVDLDRNFTHRYPEHESDAGAWPMSERESVALADFVIARKNIAAVIVYGRHDNVISVPDGRGTDVSGQGPRDLDAGDVEYYKEIAKTYKEITGQSRAADDAADTAGSFQAWMYAQRGIPTFATTLWGRPEVKADKERGPDGEDGAPTEGGAKPPAQTSPQTVAQPATAPDAQAQDPPPDDRGSGGRRRGGARSGDARSAEGRGGDRAADDEHKPAEPEAAAWLKYSDTLRNREGFVEWKPFDHPVLGKVEIGGFVPGFQMNPPASELEQIGEKQTDFAIDIINRRPRLNVEGPIVTKLADGLYEIRLGIVNEGYLPTATAMARKARSVFPSVVRISTPIDNIVAGDRATRTYGVGGSGDRATYRWIIRADNYSDIAIDITNPHLGDQHITIKAAETPAH